MASENPLWGEERIANELLLKLGLWVSPQTVRKYMPKRPPGRPRGNQRWSTFLRNHAGAIVACDFFVAVTAHPSAAWTLQQLREVVGFDRAHQYLIDDRGSIFARSLDESIRNLGLTVLKSPPHSPQANAICERVIGTIRRECLGVCFRSMLWGFPACHADFTTNPIHCRALRRNSSSATLTTTRHRSFRQRTAPRAIAPIPEQG
jgi:transposase InsO family protein